MNPHDALRAIDNIVKVSEIETLTWQERYNVAFDLLNNGGLRTLKIWEEPHIPDMSYDDDLLALVRYLKELRPKVQALANILPAPVVSRGPLPYEVRQALDTLADYAHSDHFGMPAEEVLKRTAVIATAWGDAAWIPPSLKGFVRK